ncbi:MAG: response regulator [Gemmatimonadetes bacterium]|nr:response regulator [Gemmatimonadota bacterium]
MSGSRATLAPITVVVADDEPVAREGLRRALEAFSWVRWIGEAGSGTAAVEMVDRLKPDLLFLDIEMPGGTGLDVMQRLTHHPMVVFTTAYAEYAVTAFELGSLDYLLKPFGPERLQSAMERVRAAVGEPRESPVERLAAALGTGPITRLFVRSGNAVLPVAVDALVHLEAWGDYVIAHTATSKYVIHVSLQRLEERLDPSCFVRVHRSHLVHLACVAAFRPEGGGLVAELTTGARVPVSRTHARAVRRLAR